ncbi:hypothetical protein E4U41_006985 [Claviceps citrina]|nr:hypothetical protein E4U41_006985 [Claviceps citrina]
MAERLAEEHAKVEELLRRWEELNGEGEEARRIEVEVRRCIDELKRRNDALLEKSRPTTLDEYLVAHHTSVFSGFGVEPNLRFTSDALVVDPSTKWCPENLRPWPDFFEQQRTVFGRLYDAIPTESRLFDSRVFLEGLGDRYRREPVESERCLSFFLLDTLIHPMKLVIKQLKKVEEVGKRFAMGDDVVFKITPHALSDTTEEVVTREARGWNPYALRADQICVYRTDGASTTAESRTLISVIDLQGASQADGCASARRAPADADERMPTSEDTDALFQFRAEKLVASAVTRTYHYMIESGLESGLEYGLLTTGEAIVFPKVDWAEPSTLYYHLAEPGPEVSAHPDDTAICSALGQCLAFTLMALGAPGECHQHGQDERRRESHGWPEDTCGVRRSAHQLFSADNFRDSEALTQPLMEPPMMMTVVMLKKKHQNHRPTPPSRLREKGSDAARRTGRTVHKHAFGGLVEDQGLDPHCPNLMLHRRAEGDAADRELHPVSHGKWLRLLWQQLNETLDEGITPLRTGGWRSVLFKATLSAYGYTFVGKGTVRAFIPELEHEADVYGRLRRIQGTHVPVKRTYYYDHRVSVVYMTFLSWGGLSIRSRALDGQARGRAGAGVKLAQAGLALRALQAVHDEGFVHRRVSRGNVLVNEDEPGAGLRVMLIDFEEALVPEETARWRSDKEGLLAWDVLDMGSVFGKSGGG